MNARKKRSRRVETVRILSAARKKRRVNGGTDEPARVEQVIGEEDGGVSEAGDADGAVRYFQRDELGDGERAEQERSRGEGDGGRSR